ncbi:MAG: hypothetical protein LBR88_05195 [Zoogloeaceae bacterium]|nr:hypothetical protein [Zoogloeaceae bacterium]
MIEALWLKSLAHVHDIYRGFTIARGLGQVFVVAQVIARQSLFKVFATPGFTLLVFDEGFPARQQSPSSWRSTKRRGFSNGLGVISSVPEV